MRRPRAVAGRPLRRLEQATRSGRERGATITEYSLILAFVVVGAVAILGRLQDQSGSYLVDTGRDVGEPRPLRGDLDPDLPDPPVWLTQPPPPETTTTLPSTVVGLGGFEEGEQATFGGYVGYVNGATFGPWQVGGGVSRDHAMHHNGGYGTAGHHLDLDRSGSVTRTVTDLIAGASYELSFVTASHIYLPSGPVSAEVVVDGVSMAWSPPTRSDGVWTTMTVPFTATTGTISLTFRGTGSPVEWGGVLVDDPTIRWIAPPSPTTTTTTTTPPPPETTTTTAPTPPPSPAVPGRLVAAHAGKCLELPGGGTNDDLAIIMTTCNGSPQQLFTLRSLSGGDVEIITSAGKCLRPLGGSDVWATRIVQNACDQTPVARWTHAAVAAGLELRSKPTSLCLDVFNWVADDGAEIIQWGCHGGTNQAFGFDGTIG